MATALEIINRAIKVMEPPPDMTLNQWADIPEDEINNTRYSKTQINDLKALVAKYGIDINRPLKAMNLADNNVVIYRQRLNEKI